MNKLDTAKKALAQIRDERDRVAEGDPSKRDTERYPCFDDWAADMADNALKQIDDD